MSSWGSVAFWAGWCAVALLASAAATFRLIGWVESRGVVDRPNSRSSHTRVTPRGGGLAIVAVTAWGAILAAFLYPASAWPLVAVVVPALAVAYVSWLDDIQPLQNRVRFGVHLAAAAATVAILGPLRQLDLGTLGTLQLGLAAWPISILCLSSIRFTANGRIPFIFRI